MRFKLYVCEKLWINRFCKILIILCLYVKFGIYWYILILYYLFILNFFLNVFELNWKLFLKKLFCCLIIGCGILVCYICGGGICGCGGEGGNGSCIFLKLWICWIFGLGWKFLVLLIFIMNVLLYIEIENKWKINGIEVLVGINCILYLKNWVWNIGRFLFLIINRSVIVLFFELFYICFI